ncbi:zinc finger protein 37-like isoform X2, partial [Sigmodon hispidus]
MGKFQAPRQKNNISFLVIIKDCSYKPEMIPASLQLRLALPARDISDPRDTRASAVLTKPGAVSRRTVRTADKARHPREMAASEPADSEAKEWEQPELVQKNLCNEAMLENSSNPASMGNQDPKQGLISKLEKEDKTSLGEMQTNNPIQEPLISLKAVVICPKVQQDDEQMEEKQKSQGKLIKKATFKKKSSSSKISSECALLEKKSVSTKHDSSKKRILKSDPHGKNLKQNLDLSSEIKNLTKRKPDTAKEHRKSFSHTVSDTKKDKISAKKKCEKISSNKSPGKGDKNQTENKV